MRTCYLYHCTHYFKGNLFEFSDHLFYLSPDRGNQMQNLKNFNVKLLMSVTKFQKFPMSMSEFHNQCQMSKCCLS